MRKSALLCAATILAAPVSGYAQEITSRIQGQVTDEAGAPIPGARVLITDSRTRETRTLSASADGYFSGDNLTVGGPYSVNASASGYQGQTVEAITTTLQAATSLTFRLAPGDARASDIVVTAQRANLQLRAVGPGLAFADDVLRNVPSFTNDIRDVIRLDPRVSLDRVFEVDRVSCLGGNDRNNTFTVDGQVQADVFGLNGTPFASRSVTPLPYDAIRETSVEFAPFDVQYGQFTGCAINVVSRSGTNDLHGSAFFTYTGDSLTGKSLEGRKLTLAPFNEYRWGATLGGPIIKDKLFAFFAYEESDTGDAQDRGPAGMGFANEQPFVSEAQFTEVSQVLKDVYGIETGPIAKTLPETSRRFFGRLDWLITDAHRLELTYQKLDETDIGTSDMNATVLTGYNSFLNRGTASNYYSGRLFSQWNDKLTTELRVSRAEVRDIQNPVGDTEATGANATPRIVVGVQNGTQQGSIVTGPPFFQSANDLYTEVTQARFVAKYDGGAHKLTVGVEANILDAFNLFVRNATGTLVFANINDLREGLLSNGTISSATASNNPTGAQVLAGTGVGAFGSFSATGNIEDAAAAFKRTIYSAYAQDDWQATDRLKVLAGARLDWVDGGAPGVNSQFATRYGYSNAVSFSNLDPVVLPRLALTYDMDTSGLFSRTQLRAGVGLFAGGDPAVWFSNAFSNTGAQTGFATSATTNALCNSARGADGRIDVVQNGRFTGFPQCVVTAAQTEGARSLGRTESTDPDIKTPTVIRANFSISTDINFTGGGGFLDGWRLNLDYIYSRYRNPFIFVDLAQGIDIRRGLNGYTIDGRPLYAAIYPLAAGCSARLDTDAPGPRPVYENVTAACYTPATGGTRTLEMQLTNGREFDGHVASILLSKRFKGGLVTQGGSSFVSLGYAFTDAGGRALNDDATGANNFTRNAAFDRQDPELGTSSYETRHNIAFAASFGNEFFRDLETRFGFVLTARSGRPFSYVFDSFNSFANDASSDNELLYVPTGPGDPNVVYSASGSGATALTAAQNEQLFNDYIDANPCLAQFRGRTATRGACRNDWYTDLDLQFSQELPGPLANDRLRLIVNFDNFLNFLDDKWNLLKRKSAFQQNVPVIGINSIDAQGRYVLGGFSPFDTEAIQNNASLWRVQFGIRYNF
ncbi:MAG TPA: TonB-dependent receptor [Novosphingobium sp.]|nr:TonB-dependent receptor [Novosphingobium sp.]